jgi:two-component sensor histidine kinase
VPRARHGQLMERDLTYAALDAIAFVTGAALSAMLGLMQWRVDRATGRTSGYLLLWALGFIWTFGNFLRCTLELAGAQADSTAARFAETFAWSGTLLGPVTIGRLLQGGIGATSRVSRAFLAVAVGVSLLNLAMLVRANYQHHWDLDASAYPTTSFYVALVLGAAAVFIYWRNADAQPRKYMPRWFAPAGFLFAGIHTSAILLSMQFPHMPEPLMTAASLIGRHWIIPWSVLIAVSLAQAHYADVVLKRSLWLLVSIVVATGVGLVVVDGLGAAPGLPLLVTVLALAVMMWVTPLLIRALAMLVDGSILHRPDYVLASRALDESFRRAADPAQLVEAALSAVRSTLHVDAHWAESTRQLDIAVSHQARTLLQPELAFLESVGTQLSHRLEAMRLETEQRAMLLREERLKRLLTEAELKALRTQVDPHFLFNTLNTIADLIDTNPQQAERMTERLAECFRYALAKHSRNLSTLDEELAFARHYLEIEQVRFGDRLRVQLSRGDALGSEAVPSLLLQPLLENAIRHGLAPVREGGCVRVSAHLEGERLRLAIEDDGVGMRPGARPGVGLENVQQRLRALYAQAAEFLIGARPDGRGTLVTIAIPLTAPSHAH